MSKLNILEKYKAIKIGKEPIVLVPLKFWKKIDRPQTFMRLKSNQGLAPIVIVIIAAVVLVGAGIGGYLVFWKNNVGAPTANPIISTSTSVQLNAPSSSLTIDTSNWKTYRNEQYGVELIYPPNWIFSANMALSSNNPDQDKNFLHISIDNKVWDEGRCPSSIAGLRLQVGQRKTSQSFEEFVRTQAQPGDYGPWGSVESANIGGRQAFRVQHGGGEGCDGPFYFVDQDVKYFSTISKGFGSAVSAEDVDKFDRVVNSIKFIPFTRDVVDDTSAWKNYRIGAEGFEGTSKAVEFKYPSEWNVISSGIASVIIFAPNNVDTLSVFKQDTNPEGALRVVNGITDSSPYQFLNIQGKKLVGESGVKGKKVNILILKLQNIYYVIQTPPELFERVVSTFKFIGASGVPTELEQIIKSVPELSSGYIAKSIGLNGDAINEFIINPIPPSLYVGASGNRPYFIYQKINGGWVNIGRIDGNQYTILETKTGGYQDIETKFHNSASSYTDYIYKWGASKSKYIEANSTIINL